MVTTQIEWLTAADAAKLLEHNTHNRPLREGEVMKWAAAMEAGQWILNGETIKVADDGTIIDGQHRLTALSLQNPGVAIQVLVVRDLPMSSQKTVDLGPRRGAQDQLVLAGVAASRSLAAAIKLYLLWQEGLLFNDRKMQAARVTTPAIVDWAVEHGEEVDLLRRGLTYSRIPTRPAIVGASYLRSCEVNGVEATDQFFTSLQDGVGLYDGDPQLALRKRLEAIRGMGSRSQRQQVPERDILGAFAQAINHFTAGRKVQKLQQPKAGWTASTFPDIV